MASSASKMPKNFSWVIDEKLCGMGFPGQSENMVYLLENNVKCLISLTPEREPPVHDFKDMDFFPVKVLDFTPPSQEQIDHCLEAISKANFEGKAAGVHCAHGQGRTGTVLACYLVKFLDYSGEDAIKKIRLLRPGSIETSEQEQAIRDFDRRIHPQTD
ncbi:hypothetical protein ACJMK2_041604 [Sinanodonta woodiana]|uniref:Dual specificity protein phosphatase 23 n=1 Tax=Sinanodonta woodiana TaxID=1069815 RepID=A0ABD3W4N6_SINWO